MRLQHVTYAAIAARATSGAQVRDDNPPQTRSVVTVM